MPTKNGAVANFLTKLFSRRLSRCHLCRLVFMSAIAGFAGTVKYLGEQQPCRLRVRGQHLAIHFSITPHQFQKAQRVAHGMDLADLVGVNSCDWD